MDLRITKLAGDGIGPEVVNEAVKVCDSVAKKFNHNIIWDEGIVGANAIEKVLLDPQETKKRMIEAKKHALNNFTKEKMGNFYYDELLMLNK